MEKHSPDDRKWHLAAKALTDSLTPEEQAEWEVLKDDGLFQEDFARVKLYWEKLPALPYRQIDVENDWKIVMEKARLDQEEPVSQGRPWLRYAAAVSVFLIASVLLWRSMRGNLSKNDKSFLTTIVAPTGSKTLVTLPDSSTVWLNAGSKVSFNNSFGADNRDIALEGEAFFDVIRNKVPFNVHTDQFDIAVLGTAFNIKAYKDDDKATATLVRGSLKVKRANLSGTQDEILLAPNDRLTLYKGAAAPSPGSFTVKVDQKINAERETSWKDGWLSIEGESLNEFAVKLERLYDIKIVFSEETLKDYRFTGRIRQLSLEQVLKALSLTSPVQFSIDEKTVTLSENKQMKSKYRSLQMP